MCSPRRVSREREAEQSGQADDDSRARSIARLPTRWKRTSASSCWARTWRIRRTAESSASPKGSPRRFGDHRVRSTPISEQAIVGAAIGASLVGWKPVAEIMLMNFTDGRHGHDREPCRQAPLHVRRTDPRADHDTHHDGRGNRQWRAALGLSRSLVRAHGRNQSHRAVQSGGRVRASALLHR